MLSVVMAAAFSAGLIGCGLAVWLAFKMLWPRPEPLLVLGAGLGLVGVGLAAIALMPRRHIVPHKRQLLFDVARAISMLGRQPSDSGIDARLPSAVSLHVGWHSGTLTVEDVYQLMTVRELLTPEEGWPPAAGRWLLECENEAGGFGIWPGSSSRLSATNYALAGIRKCGLEPKNAKARHVAWIGGCYCNDGCFASPYGARPRWEDTLFAVASTDLLGEVLPLEMRERCRQWTVSKLYEALKNNHAECVCACLKTLRLLDGLDESTRKSVQGWLRSRVPELGRVRPVGRAGWVCSILESASLAFDAPALEYFSLQSIRELGATIANVLVSEVSSIARGKYKLSDTPVPSDISI